MGFWDFLSRRDPVPVAAMTPNVTYVNSREELLDALGIRGLSVAQLWSTQPHLRTVVSFRARNVAHLGLHCFTRNGDDRKRDRTSTLAQLLRRPNSSQTAFDLIYALVGDFDLYDRAYWLVTPDLSAPSGWSIHRLPPSWVTVSKKDTFSVTEYLVTRGEDQVAVSADQIMDFTGYHPTSATCGSSTVESLRETLAEQVEAAKFRSQVWKRGGRVSAVLQRPTNAPEWGPEARDRFREDWYAKYTGNGAGAGGTPILEDGMTLQRIDFNAQEQQFVEAAKLALSTVAAAYHINPTMVGVLDNANYSNVREFRRMLYGDSLGPLLAQIEDRINTFLLPMIGANADTQFVEFNIAEKLQGSFEEQAAVMQTLVGAPIMTRDEGRAKINLPALGGEFEKPVTPLNVLVGGQASPTDSGSQNQGPKAALPRLKAAPDSHREQVARVLGRFFDRQGKSVLSAIGSGRDWWDAQRWDAELTADLSKVSYALAEILGKAEAERLGYAEDFDPAASVNFLRKVAEDRAAGINATTKQQLDAALTADGDPAVVFETAKNDRAQSAGHAVAAFVAGFAGVEAAKQIAARRGGEPTKTWVTGPNPRADHAAMDGETVPIDQQFSNGMDWTGQGGPDDAGCNCSTVVNL